VEHSKRLRTEKMKAGICPRYNCTNPLDGEHAQCKPHMLESAKYQRVLMRKRRRRERDKRIARTCGPFVWVG
jgi:hypothetical protein